MSHQVPCLLVHAFMCVVLFLNQTPVSAIHIVAILFLSNVLSSYHCFHQAYVQEEAIEILWAPQSRQWCYSVELFSPQQPYLYHLSSPQLLCFCNIPQM